MAKSLSRKWQAATAALLLGSTLAMTGTGPAKAQQEPLKLGLVASITGPGAFLGDPFDKAAKLAVDRVNAAGGVNGRKIELVAYDCEGSPDKALVFAKKLISEDKVAAILGPDFSATVRAILPTTEEAKVPVLFNTPVIEPQPHSFNFSPWPSEETSYQVAFDWLKKRGVKKVGVIATTDTTGESGLAWINKMSAANGITVTTPERFAPADKDVTPQLTNVKSTSPDTVFFVGSGAAVAVVSRAYTRLGMTQPLVISTGAVSATFPELLKGITPDMLVFPTYKMLVVDSLPASDPNRKPIEDFAKLYESSTGKKADFYGGAGWDLANVAIEAFKKAGDDRTKIRDAIEQVKDYPGTMAMLSFSPEKHRGASPDAQVMGQFKDGKFVLVTQ